MRIAPDEDNNTSSLLQLKYSGRRESVTVQERLRTAQDLWTRSHQSGESARLELMRGKIVEMAPTGGLHGLVTMELSRLVANYVREHELGAVIAPETGFILATNPDTVRAPDVAFIAKERLPRPIPQRYFPLAPDLAVEWCRRATWRRTCGAR